MSSTKFHIMAKPASFKCNLKCDYCFYLEKENFIQESNDHYLMSDSSMRNYIKNYIRDCDLDVIDFAWQGGEPTLAGLDFFERAVNYQKKYSNGKKITNSFQTNAISINSKWAEFFHKNNFLLGVSIDGISDVHDRYRISINGNPTFEKVKSSIELLIKHNVEFNTLTVVNDKNWHRGKETYQALKSMGVEHMQFIPIVEVDQNRTGCNGANQSIHDINEMASFSVPPHGFGVFLSDVFEQWVREDIGKIYVQTFESILSTWIGHGATICHHLNECGASLVLEHNGDLYSCDHYVYPSHKLGNIHDTSIEKLVSSKKQTQFGKAKYKKVSESCRRCEYYSLCNSGCPKHRIIKSSGEKYKENYLCESYKLIFSKTSYAMKMMVNQIQSGGSPQNIMALYAMKS
ncbi:anaerobic sulfatase maturase [Vibrio sp. SCSIO 43135]|uniref:anaerobic sulfatase maturase n=1 Tax=Vibrio sp. SCSIO 43135 TaxID=2819096 RepID=UPI002074EAAD|nr:anaerobic sulfatase maturase [Vibrio sp. SCSIO 43135]USD43242.1 anaerobic sulfatase maturase [Vibrio sp. SCSIO 43135]